MATCAQSVSAETTCPQAVDCWALSLTGCGLSLVKVAVEPVRHGCRQLSRPQGLPCKGRGPDIISGHRLHDHVAARGVHVDQAFGPVMFRGVLGGAGDEETVPSGRPPRSSGDRPVHLSLAERRCVLVRTVACL